MLRENKSENIEEINNITDKELNFLISNKKISSRFLSLIEIIDKMILNQFFISYNCFLEYCIYDNEEPFELILNKNEKTKDDFKSTQKFYKNLSEDSNNNNNKNPDEINFKNKNIRYPFDIFGTETFLRIFLSIENQSREVSSKIFFADFFNKNLKKKLLLNFEDLADFLVNIVRIQQIRHYIEHNGNIKDKEKVIKFIKRDKKEDLKKYNKIAKTEFSLLKSLQAIFIFLPDIELSEFYQLIIAERSKDFDTDDDEFKKNINKIFEFIRKKNRKNIINIAKELTESEKYKLKKKEEEWGYDKLIQKNYKPFEFVKMYNLIGEFNINTIKNILKNILENYSSLKSDLRMKDYEDITFEEIRKIFYFFIGINEILRNTFIRIYEQLNNYIENDENFKKLKNQLDVAKNQLNAAKNQLNAAKCQKEESKIRKKINKMLIKSHIAELIRNNLAHSNLFFYFDKNYFDKNELLKRKINIENLNNYTDIFYIYIFEIFKFYNIKHNQKIYKCLKLEKTIKQEKLLFIKKISSFLLKKDYLFLLVSESTKNKKGEEGIKYEIQKLAISTEEKDTKEAFKKIIKAKIKGIIENQNKKIKGSIMVKKYKFYYFLKKVLIEKLNSIKEKDRSYNYKK